MKKIEVYLNGEIVNAFQPLIGGMEKFFAETMREYFGDEEIKQILFAAHEHFERVKTTLPNVGPDSPWLKNMIGIVYEIGLWKELLKRGLSLNDISILNQKTLAALFQKTIMTSNIDKIGTMLCSLDYVKRIADDSKKQAYPDDWLFDCVRPGKKDLFHVGMNIYKCPIALLCKRFEVESFFPYLCLNDYVTHGMLGIELVRTKTLAHGAECCDFRLIHTGKQVVNIITEPDELAEFQDNI